jgi:hypothetical protein
MRNRPFRKTARKLLPRASRLLILLTLLSSVGTGWTQSVPSCLTFEVGLGPQLSSVNHDGRLFIILSRTNSPEPRFSLQDTGPDAPQTLAQDLHGFGPGKVVLPQTNTFSFPLQQLAQLPSGDYFAQAVFDWNRDLRMPDAPSNLFTTPLKIHFEPGQTQHVALQLTSQIPAENLPADASQLRFVKIQSRLLSEFYGRPIFLRAGIVLPRDFKAEDSRRYPLWVQIGGFATRYDIVRNLMKQGSHFCKVWLADETPRFILLQLDGAGPYGDPYYVNSANNGPYGDALVQELIPFVESNFHAIGKPTARVLSGTSTGGWVCLALQIFYPDFFNGAWSSSPDPVDFRAYELVNIYKDDNAYVNRHGNERPSQRDLGGDVVLTMRREAGVENLLGRGNSYTLSGGQWGAWNAVFSPRGADGLPVPLWDPQTGHIDHSVAQQWKKYDLRLLLEENWKTLAPKLRGKLHIAAGEADDYFLNDAVHLLDDFLAEADPPFEGSIVYSSRGRHGWTNVNLSEMLKQMSQAMQEPNQ